MESESQEYIDISLHNEGMILDAATESALELYLQEIEIGIKTKTNEIWGERNYVDIEQYLFSQNIWLGLIERELTEYITQNCSQASRFPTSISAKIEHADNQKILLIECEITDLENQKQFVKYYFK